MVARRQALVALGSVALWGGVLRAQQSPADQFARLRGTVISGFTSAPVANAQVVLGFASPGRFYGAVTDTLGRFRIDSILPGRYAVRAQFISYAPDSTQLDLSAGDSVYRTFVLKGVCKYDSALAERDTRHGHAKILLHGGIAPQALSSSDEIAERKYGFQYYEFGDQIIEPFDCDDQYNRVVFRHLDRRYGVSWRDSVRIR